MDSNHDLENTSRNHWTSLPDFYEDMFDDDEYPKRSNSTVYPLGNTISELSSTKDQTSYITLEASDYTQESNNIQQVANLRSEGNPEEVEPQNTGARITLHKESNPNSRDLDSTINHTPILLNADGTSIQIISSPFHMSHTQILPTVMENEFQSVKVHNQDTETVASSSGLDQYQATQQLIQGSIIKANRFEDKETEPLSLDEVVKNCLSGVQHLEDMQFFISNTKNDGKEFVKLELTIPRNSLATYGRSNDLHSKQVTVKKMRRENSDDSSIDALIENGSLSSSNNILSPSQSSENAKQGPRISTPQEIKHIPRKGLEVNKMTCNLAFHQHDPSNKSIDQLPSDTAISLRSKLLPEEIGPPDLCKVCGAESSKFIHYGGRGCQSCRAFFRRIVEKRNRYPWLQPICSCNERCMEHKKLLCSDAMEERKKCKYCRFERCQTLAGMEVKWVISQNRKTTKIDIRK